ncbi:MAG: SAM-dependent methyltransferase [Fibromonadales bacterium]|nr:SAM-dependent methyltransferase [Fibromonadales bacterium]
MFKFYTDKKIKAVDAKFEAQRIAFMPLAFQSAYSMRELGILEFVSKAGSTGASTAEISRECSISEYGAQVLAEIGLGMGIFKLADEGEPLKYALGKTGFFILHDEMTKVNMDFVQDVCYEGAKFLKASVKNSKPEGLKVFGKWNTIYEGLSQLPQHAQKSWFAFDHFYSDLAFPEALPIVFRNPPRKLVDIGGNTAKWAISACKYNPDVQVVIADLPGQISVAKRNVESAGFAARVLFCETNVLNANPALPTDADAVWMSQFLDCFSLEEITGIIKNAGTAMPNANFYVLEPLWDMQKFEASSYSLQATSLYFTCMANGNSKMYRFAELVNAIEKGGVALQESHHNIGANSYSLLRFRRAS